jgi:hypothetical protein
MPGLASGRGRSAAGGGAEHQRIDDRDGPAAVALEVIDSPAPAAAVEHDIEELIVRRELAHNYAWFESDYDSYGALPE